MDFLKWIIKRLGLDKAFNRIFIFLAERFHSYQRKALIVLLFITFVCLGDGWHRLWVDVTQNVVTRIKVAMAGALGNPPINQSTNVVPANSQASQSGPSGTTITTELKAFFWRNIWVFLSWIGWLVLSVLISLAITGIVDAVVEKSSSGMTEDVVSRYQKLIELLARTGIQTVYDGVTKKPGAQQPYAECIRAEVSKTKTFKLMTIAGFEHIGKGGDSLLWDVIKQNQNISLEIILLDPVEGQKIIEERLENLRERDDTYDATRLQHEIRETAGKVNNLRTVSSKAAALWYTPTHPIFRMLILDDCLFVSTYSKGHGHESPVYQLKRVDGSWYDAFVRVFESVKTSSKKQF